MAKDEALHNPQTPDTPEQAQECALLRERTKQSQKVRDIATIKALLDRNPDKATLEAALTILISKDPKARKDIEKAAIDADVEFLEALAKIVPFDHKALAHLERQRAVQKHLHGEGAIGTDVTGTKVIKPETPTSSKNTQTLPEGAQEYPKGTVVLTKDQVQKMESEYSKLSKLPISASKPKETLEAERLVEQKVAQANLLLSTGEAYRDYLASIEANIRFKNLSDKPKRYQAQIGAIDSVRARISGIAGLPESECIKELGKLDIASLVNTVFVPETKLSTFGSGFMNQPMLEIDTETHETHGSLNVSKTLAETEDRYQRMKGLITESGDWSEANTKKRKYEILTLLRLNDSRDDDSTKLNSGEAIAKQSEGDVLRSPGLRKNERIKQDFDTVLKLQSDPKAQSEFKALFFSASTPTTREVDIFFQNHGVELPKVSLEAIVKKDIKHRKTIDTVIEKERDRLASMVDKPGMFSKEFVADFKKNPEKKTREALQENFGNSLMSFANREVIVNAMKSDLVLVKTVRNSDPAVKLYTNIEGVTHTSDETVNERIGDTEFFLEQVLIMYASGYIGGQFVGFARGVAGVKEATALASVFESGATAAMRGKRALAFAGETAIDGGTFAVSYSTLSELAKHEYVDQKALSILKEVWSDGNNWNDNLRIVAFLGVMKAMMPIFAKVPNPQDMVGKMIAREFPELAVKIGESPMAAKGLQLSRSVIQGIENIMLDTTALLGTDTVIRGLKGEDLPKNIDDIPNYLLQEFNAIIKYVVVLRGMSGELFQGPLPPDITKEAKAQIIVNIEKNGDIAIRTLEGRVVVIKKELQALDLRHNRLVASGHKSHGEKQKIAQAKRQKKAELKDAVADTEEMQRVVSENRSENTKKSVDSGAQEVSHDTSLAGVGANAKKESQTNTKEGITAKTSTNHTTTNVRSLEINPKMITLSDTLSGFSPSRNTNLNTDVIGKNFQALRDGMKNVESPELLQKQAETVISQELRTKYNEIMKDYDKLTPEAQQAMITWGKSMEQQAKDLANDFQNALKAKLEGGRMNEKWGNPEYMDRVMGMFAEKASEQLKNSITQKHPATKGKKPIF